MSSPQLVSDQEEVQATGFEVPSRPQPRPGGTGHAVVQGTVRGLLGAK